MDIVRHLVVNEQGQSEEMPVQNPNSPLTRADVISGIINAQKYPVMQSLVLQALFIDWLFYDE